MLMNVRKVKFGHNECKGFCMNAYIQLSTSAAKYLAQFSKANDWKTFQETHIST